MQNGAPTQSPGRDLAVLVAVRRVTVRQLAKRTGISYWRIGRILRDESRPRDGELARLTAAIFQDDDRVPG